jgi:addiction module HigA family antidote
MIALHTEARLELGFSNVAGSEHIGPVTPGGVLRIVVPFGLYDRALARELGVPSNRITEIVACDCAILAGTAIMLAGRLGTSAECWLNLQKAQRHRRGAA